MNKNKLTPQDVKPGMVINIVRAHAPDYYDACLVIATEGRVKISYTYLDYQEAYGGALIGKFSDTDKIYELTGDYRALVIKSVKKDLSRNKYDIEHLIDMVRLIEAMDERGKNTTIVDE